MLSDQISSCEDCMMEEIPEDYKMGEVPIENYKMGGVTPSRPFYCEECNKTFSTKRNHMLHEMTHTGEKPFECSQCGKAFKTNHELTMHNR